MERSANAANFWSINGLSKSTQGHSLEKEVRDVIERAYEFANFGRYRCQFCRLIKHSLVHFDELLNCRIVDEVRVGVEPTVGRRHLLREILGGRFLGLLDVLRDLVDLETSNVTNQCA